MTEVEWTMAGEELSATAWGTMSWSILEDGQRNILGHRNKKGLGMGNSEAGQEDSRLLGRDTQRQAEVGPC